MAFAKSYENLKRQVATPSQKDYFKDIIPFGVNDDFPLRLARLVQNSPTASPCIDTIADFYNGSGFADPNQADIKVNKEGLRFGDIHSDVCASYALFEGFALNVKYNVEGVMSEVYNVPFEYCRLAIPNDNGVISQIIVNPYFGTAEYNIKYTKKYDVYNPDPKVVLAQQAKATDPETGKCNYKGQILYVAKTSPLSRFYPAPGYYSAGNWMIVDEAIGGFHKNNIENNFLQSVLLNFIGDDSQPSTHPDDQQWNDTTQQYEPIPSKTLGYRINLEMQKFMGWENAGNMMSFWSRTKDEAPTISAFPSQNNADLFRTIQDICTEQIARGTRVPTVLANIQSGQTLGGDGNLIRASVKVMNHRTKAGRELIARTYNQLFANSLTPINVTILEYNPFPESEKVDPLLWEALTLEEKRLWIKDHSIFELIEVKPTDQVTEQPTAPVNKFENIFYADFPEGAKKKAQKAVDFKNSTNSICGTKAGWQMCDDIINGRPLSYKLIRRVYNYLSKKKEFSNGLFSESCDALLFSAWGGLDMLNWASNKIASINE